MTRKVEFPDLVIPFSDLNREHSRVSDPVRGVVCDELVVEALVPESILKVGIHQIDVQHLFG